MAYFLFKCWRERLFAATREQITLKKTDLPIKFIPINEANSEWVKELRGEVYVEQFKYQCSMGDFGTDET